MTGNEVEGLLRQLAPQVLGALVRRYGHFETAEDAVQEALIAAATQWPRDGVPDRPRGWLITVAQRLSLGPSLAPAADRPPPGADDTLILLFMCCHPALPPAGQIALTLRAVGGLTTAEIARAFLVPEATMTRRISRAKQRIKDSGVPFALPDGPERGQRLGAVLHVLYLIFNEGYASTAGPELHRTELTTEAIRLARLVHRLLPGDGEVTGLLALMLLTDARRPARAGPDGELVPMAEQDRSRWHAGYIAEGTALISSVLPRGAAGPYQLQAAIAAVHDEAPSAAATDWPQTMALYEVLMQISDNPVVGLNRAVAVAMVQGPQAGLDLLAQLATDRRIAADHRLAAVHGHLLELAGDRAAARESYLAAAVRATNPRQQRYLYTRRPGWRTGDRSGPAGTHLILTVVHT